MQSPIQFIQKCKICGKLCDPKQTTKTNPLCLKHEEEHHQREHAINKGGGNDESTDPEMKAMEARDLNPDEGNK